MKLYINGLTIEGTHSEMMDFAELWQTRTLAAAVEKFSAAPSWKDDHQATPSAASFDTETARKDEHLKPIQTPHNLRGMKIETVPAGTANVSVGKVFGVYDVVEPAKTNTTRADAKKPIKPLPPVKHTDVVPADAPVTVVPTGVSGKRGRAAANGLASRIRFAIFNGKTTRAAIIKALGVAREVIHNSFYSLIETGHIEPVTPKAGRMSENDAYRLTEYGLSFIESDKKKLTNMGILKEG